MTDEQRVLRDSVRDFVSRERLRERARRWDREARFPRDAWAQLAATGLERSC